MKITTAGVVIVLVVSLVSLLSMSANWLEFRSSEAQIEVQQGQQQSLVADAGTDLIVTEGDLVVLNGTGSLVSGPGLVSYSWGIEDSDDEAPPILLNGSDKPVATFVAPPVAGGDVDSYLFELRVKDGDGLLSSDFVKVVVNKGAN